MIDGDLFSLINTPHIEMMMPWSVIMVLAHDFNSTRWNVYTTEQFMYDRRQPPPNFNDHI